MRVAVVTGLRREAACFAEATETGAFRVVCAGARSEQAAALAENLIREGFQALVSFGVAGGLDPRLRAGDLVIPETVVAPDGGRFEPDPSWSGRLRSRCAEGTTVGAGLLAGSDRPVIGPADKEGLRRGTGAVGVDMESHAVARIAHAAGVPFLAVRAVADTAERAMPAWLPGTIDASGSTRTMVVVAGLLGHPRQIAALIRLGRDFDAAIRTLRRVAVDARPLLEVGTH